MFRFQYSVTTKASRRLAWEVFSNWRRWNEFANVYGQVEWREGRPWEAGSRLEIEVLEPVKTVVSHVITNCQPAHKVGWIDHSLGVVLAQWVSFEEHARKGTRVYTWGDIVHSGVEIAGKPRNKSSPASRRRGTRIFVPLATSMRKHAATERESNLRAT